MEALDQSARRNRQPRRSAPTDDVWLGTFMSQQTEGILRHFKNNRLGDYVYTVDTEFPYTRFLRNAETLTAYLNRFERPTSIEHDAKNRAFKITIKWK